MDKNVSIVPVDKRPYRVIAQENWGLTDEQMKGKHVHHRIYRSSGGTNDATNLYVCSPWYHDVIWHDGSGGFIELAVEAGQKAAKKLHSEKDNLGRSRVALKRTEEWHAEKDENGKSVHAMKCLKIIHSEKDEEGKSLHAVKAAKSSHSEKDENGRSVKSVKAVKKLNGQRWQCTVTKHITTPGALTHYQKARGIDPSNRIRLS
jgi:hypothetical protein